MSSSTIAISFKRPADRRLVTEFLSSLGYKIQDLSKANGTDLVLVDSKKAKDLGKKFFKDLKDADPGFLPIMVTITPQDKPDNWLSSGVIDDCLRLPLTKSELENRIKVFLRIRSQARTIKRRDTEIRAIVESSKDHIFMLNSEGRFISSNGSVKYLNIQDSNHIVGKTLKQLFPADIAEKFHLEAKKALKNNSARSFDFTLKTGSDKLHQHVTLFPINLPGEENIVGGSCRDITELVESELERRLLASAMEQTAEGIIITNSHQEIVVVNNRFEKMSGYQRQELLGKNPSIFCECDAKQNLFQPKNPELDAIQVWRGDMAVIKKDGSKLVVEATASPVSDGREGNRYFVYTFRDVTEERGFEKRKEQVKRLEAIGTLAGGIAHDFNNILTPIMGYAEIAKGAIPPGDKLENYIEQIILASARAKELVKQILTFSRQAKRKRVPLNIYSIVKEAIKLIRAALPAEIVINQQIDAVDKYVLADPTEIHQIVINLCTNAWHAMVGGGILTCSLEEIHVTRELALNIQHEISPGAYIKFSVADTGHGIPKEIINRIFEPYFTTKKEDKGTGLGLSTVHGIVTDYGGCIDVKSKLGEGTVFDVYFPVYKGEKKAFNKRKGVENTRQGGEILFVDDEPTIAELAKISLEKRGYSVSPFSEPEAALSTFEQNPHAFHVVITDMSMPGINGLQLAKRVRILRPDLPIIICTGFSDKIDSSEINELGAIELVIKPFTAAELIRAVEKALSK